MLVIIKKDTNKQELEKILSKLLKSTYNLAIDDVVDTCGWSDHLRFLMLLNISNNLSISSFDLV